MNIDQWISVVANQTGMLTPFTKELTVFCAEYFPYLVVVAFLYCAFRSRQAFFERIHLFVEGVGAGIVARIGVEAIRFFIHRPRPFVDNSAITALITETSYSFPSGHTTFFFALATTVYLHNKRWGIWFYIAGIIIGFARVFAGVHYFSDIVVGAVLGIAVSMCVRFCLHRIHLRRTIPPLQ